MRRNCNLELQLLPASSAADFGGRRQDDGEAERRQEEVMTIFYDGKVVCATEFQARAILAIASREMEERGLKTPTGSPACASPSMKRSLQHFLQKRRSRVQATSPYHR